MFQLRMFVEKEVNNVYINPHTKKKKKWMVKPKLVNKW